MVQWGLEATIEGAARLAPDKGQHWIARCNVVKGRELDILVHEVADENCPYVQLDIPAPLSLDVAFLLRKENDDCIEVEPSRIGMAPQRVRLAIDVGKIRADEREGCKVECKLELLVMESISMKLTKAFTAHRDRVLKLKLTLELRKKSKDGTSKAAALAPAGAAAAQGHATAAPPAPAAAAAVKASSTTQPAAAGQQGAGASSKAAAPVLGSSPRSPGSAGAALFGSPGGRPSRSDCLELLADLKAAEAAAATAASLQPAGLLGGSGSNGGGGGSRRSASEAAATGERKRGREAPPAATSSGMNSKQADPARVSANAAELAADALRCAREVGASGRAYSTAVAHAQRSLGGGNAQQAQQAVRQFQAARHASMMQRMSSQELAHTLDLLLEALDSSGSSGGYSDSVGAAVCRSITTVSRLLREGELDCSDPQAQSILERLESRVAALVGLTDQEGQRASITAEQAAAVLQESAALQQALVESKAAAEAAAQQVQADLAHCRANVAQLVPDPRKPCGGISFDGVMPPESSQNRTNGRGAALKETVRLVYMVACGGNPRRLGALPNTVLHLDRGEPQAAKAVLAGLPEDSPLLVQYKQFCSEKYKGKSGDFKATTLARTAFKAAKKAVDAHDKRVQQGAAGHGGDQGRDQTKPAAADDGAATAAAAAAAARQEEEEVQVQVQTEAGHGDGQQAASTSKAKPTPKRKSRARQAAAATEQFCSWEEALPTPESMDSDAAVLHVAKRNILAMLTDNVCTMDALNLVTERDFDPAKLAEHTLADTAPVSLQAWEAHVKASDNALHMVLAAAREAVRKDKPWLFHTQAKSAAGKALMSNSAHREKLDEGLQRFHDALKEDADARGEYYDKAAKLRKATRDAPANAAARHKLYEKEVMHKHTVDFRKNMSAVKKRAFADRGLRLKIEALLRWQKDPLGMSAPEPRAVVENLFGKYGRVEADTCKEITAFAYCVVDDEFAPGREAHEHQPPENIWLTGSPHLYNWPAHYKDKDGLTHTAVPDMVVHVPCGGGGGDDGDKPPSKPERKVVAIIEIFSDQEPEEAALGYPKLRAKLQALFDAHGAEGIRVEVWVMRYLGSRQLAGAERRVERIHRFTNMGQIHAFLDERWLTAVQGAFNDIEGGQQLADELAQALEEQEAAAEA